MKAGTVFSPLQLSRSAATLALVVDKDRLSAQGERIRELRKLAHVSQETVAREVGVTMRAYQAWERGESELRYDNLRALADYLRVTPDFIEYGRPRARGETPDMAKTLDIGAEILKRLGEVANQIEDLTMAMQTVAQLQQTACQRQQSLYNLIEQVVGDRVVQAAIRDMPLVEKSPASRRRRRP